MRTLTAAIITVGLVASLSACATGAPSGSCEPSLKSGGASELVTATGKAGTLPTVKFPVPLITKGTEVSTISAGDGKKVYPGEIADFHVTVANAKTAKIIPISGIDPDSILRRTAGDTNDTFGVVLECTTIGDRLAVTIPAEDIGLSGTDIEPTDTVVLIIDVVRSFLGRADGVPQLAENGMPAIALAPSGQPGVTIPKSAAPDELRIATTIKGDGATVGEDDAIVIHSTTLLWGSRSVVDSTWAWNDQPPVPNTVVATADRTGAGAGVLPGLAKALVGAKVGSQLVVVIPPGDESFASDATLPSGVAATDTLVYVVDVLGIQRD